MTNLLKYLVRRMALAKNGSKVSQRMLPLESVKSAAVFIDSGLPGADAAESAVRKFFSARNIGLLLLRPDSAQLNYAGFMRRRFRIPAGTGRGEDLFISLSDDSGNFASEFEARCSPAKFKIGCFPLEGGIYDMTVTPPDGARLDQLALFGAITEYLLKIK